MILNKFLSNTKMSSWFHDMASLLPISFIGNYCISPFAFTVYGTIISPLLIYNIYRLIFSVKVVKEGEQVVIYNHRGEGRLVVGPRRLALFRERLHRLLQHRATRFEYLIVTHIDGKVTHFRGPCELFDNPLLYECVKKENAVKLDGNHLIVAYCKQENGGVQRRTIQGPAVFVPTADEWLHEFTWHGADQLTQRRLLPAQFKSTQVPTIPDQFYYNIREVRTTDDTMITVRLMVFYQMKDVLVMGFTRPDCRHEKLSKSHDPIADMKNALCSDVIGFASKLTYDQFLEKTHELSSLSTYPQSLKRMERIGFEVHKVVYRGYHASDRLQEMQNSAIESRTELRLNTEFENVHQKLTDMKLSKEQARLEIRQRIDKNKQEHAQNMAILAQKHQLQQKQIEHEQQLLLEAKKSKVHLDQKVLEDEQKENYLKSLKNLEVDLSTYLTELNAPSQLERVEVF